MIQEIITYTIVAVTAGYVVFRLVRLITKRTTGSSCGSPHCDGCSFKEKCEEGPDNKTGVRVILLLLLSWAFGASAQQAGSDSEKQNQVRILNFNTTLTSDFCRNLSGGVKKGNAHLGNINIRATFDTERARFWKGGTLHIDLLNNHGESLSAYVGDIQGVDNIETTAHSRLFQLWYNQNFGKLSVTIGQHDLNSEFCVTEFGSAFINSSFGIQPEISTNVPVSIFPVTTPGLLVTYKPSDNISILSAVYDGDPGDPEENPNSLKWKLDKSEGALSILEMQYHWERDGMMKGSYKAGVWLHSSSSNYGIYLIGDHTIFTEKSDGNQGLGVFTQLGVVPGRNCFPDYFASVGLHFTGLLKGRDKDRLGLALGNASVSPGCIPGQTSSCPEGETVLELTYQSRIRQFFTIQPDLQYIVKPVYAPSRAGALVGIIRVIGEF